MQLWKQVIIALILGALAGVYLPGLVPYIKPLGDIFLRLIKMLIVPLIFFSLVSGVTSLNDSSSIGRVGTKAIIAFTTTTFFAVMFGMLVSHILKPGLGVKMDFGTLDQSQSSKFDFVKFFIDVIPDNIVMALAQGNILQVVFFAIFVGYTINILGEQGGVVKDLVHSVSKVVLKMISFIINFSPYGVFGIVAYLVHSQGFEVIYSLSKLVWAILLAMFFQYIIFGVLIYIFGRLSPFPFYRKSLEYQAMAFSTSSSKATLPTTMQVCREKLGISKSSTSFILPLGAAINMDGLAIKLGLSVIFVAHVLGAPLSFHDYIIIIITATLGSIGGAGIPGSYLIMLPVVLSSVNLPIEAVAILAGIDRILDMVSTTINITGDTTVTLIVDNSEGTLDKKVYYS